MTGRRIRTTAVLLVVLLAALAAPTPAGAQQTTGIIEGRVVDQSGGVLPGATVTLRNAETGVERSGVTDADGRYRFPALPPGDYTVRVELAGFATEERRSIVLTIGLENRQDFQLKVQALEESITVIAEAPVVDVARSEVAGVVTQKQIETLPINTRQYLNLALLMPGTSQDAVRVFYNNVNVGSGGSFYSNGFIADGVTNTWAEQGEPRQNFPQDSIREFKVNTTQYKAEYGLATGGLITVVTKSGTNEFHGNAFEYFRHKALNAKNFFERTKPDFERHQFGASLGGPIKRDRTHFFAAAERTATDEYFTVSTGRPEFYSAVEGTFPQPRRVNLYSLRVDHVLTPTQNLFARYAHEDERSDCAGSSCGGRISANSGYDMEIPRRAIVVGHTWFVTPGMLNEFVFQFAKAAYQIAPAGKTIYKVVGDYPPERLERIERRYQFPSLTYGGNYEALGPEDRWQIKNALTWHLPDARGSHDLKVGFDFSHVPFADDSQVNLNGTYQFGSDQFFDPNDPASVASLQNPILFTMTYPPAFTRVPTQHLSFFVQDDWKPLDRLTINAGLRYDRQFGSFNEDIDPAMFRIPIPFIDPASRGDKNNLGPRFGFAYDVGGTGTTAIRGGYGLYYDNIRTLQNFGEWRNLERYDIRITNPPYPDPFLGRDPLSFASTAPANITILSNDFINPYSHQMNLGFSRQIAGNLALHVDAVYTKVQGDRQTRNINLADPVTGVRPLPQWARIDEERSTSESKYRALYLRMNRSFADRYQFLVSYSLVKAEDNGPSSRIVDQSNEATMFGPANFERRHSLVASGAILLPFDIQLGAVWTLRSSLPFTATAGTDVNRDGFVTDFVPGTSRNQGHRDLDLSAVNAWRALANLAPVSEDDIDSTKFQSVDLRASRAIPIGSQRLELLAQVFNVFNSVNLTGLQTNARATTFGQASRAGAGTQAELAVRFIW
jgi:outer membrane receptor protein involved in Fe transport